MKGRGEVGMVLTKNKGFSLIELMIVIAIIGILVAVALPQFASMSEDAKKTKAKQDCDTIVQAVTRFNALEGVALKSLDELAGKYITNIKELKDPWGNPYGIHTGAGFVFSMGPDGQSPYATTKGAAATKKDDIKVPFIGELMITDALLAVDVGPTPTAAEGGTAPFGDTMDTLTLTFNKTVCLGDATPTLIAKPGPTTAGTTVDVTALLDPGMGVFDWYVGTSSEANKVTGSTTKIIAVPNKTIAGDPAVAVQKLIMYQSRDDSREIVIDINHHVASAIVPNYHHINLTTGMAKYFFEDGSFASSTHGAALSGDLTEVKYAKRSGTAVKIRRE